MNKTIQGIFARAAMTLVLMVLTASAWAWTGSGTSSDPYQITSKSDLETLRNNVNGGQNYNNVYFKQTADITLSGEWTPIGTESHPFKGHYDGGNFTITGLQVTGSYRYAGLFGYIASGDYVPQKGYFRQAELKNIHIVECNISVGSVTDSNAGAIAGKASTVDMSGCRVSGTITGYSKAGGLIGYIDQTSGVKVTDCFVDVSVTSPSQYNPYVRLMAYVSGGSPTTSGNYCHGRIGSVSAGITATSLYMVTGAPSGVTISTAATITNDGTNFYAAGDVTLTVDANHAFNTFSVSGATGYNVAADKKSATVTLASSDASVSATLQTVGGSCGTSATWALTQDGSGNYTRLTISGSGAMENYGHINDAIWHTTAPWGYNLTSVTIGNDITSIGNYAFIGCQQLSSLTIGSGVTTIGTNAIDHCDGLTEVTLSASTINGSAFKNCKGLTTVTLTASVSSIGDDAFRYCDELTRVNIQRTSGLITLGSSCFNGCNNLQYIVAPTPALAMQYKDAANWSASADKFRLAVGNQLFTATDEGGTPACQIANEDDLLRLSAAVNQDGHDCRGLTFRQTANITLTGTFTPIGYNAGTSKNFQGTYDGGEYTISGLTISTNVRFAALFGYVVTGVVKNVRLVSPSVTTSYHHNIDRAIVGTVVGRSYNGSIENCWVYNPTVSATSSNNYVGAIVGDLYSEQSRLTNTIFYSTTDYALYGHREGGSTVSNSGRGRKVIIGEGVTIESPVGLVYNADTYYCEGAKLTLTGVPPEGYLPVFSANGIAFSGNTYTVNSTDGVTLAATDDYTPIHYAVHFEGNGSTGGSMSDQPFTYGVEQNLTANGFSRTFTVTYSYNGATGGNDDATAVATSTFDGWATSDDGEKVYNDQESVSNLTATDGLIVNLYAKWTDDGSVTLPTPTKTGYTFAGWYGNAGLTDKVGDAGESYTPSAGITLYAKWTLVPVSYIDADGNTQASSNHTVLTNETNISNLSAGWYVVTEDVSYNSQFRCPSGDIHLILCDGAKMTVTNSGSAIRVDNGNLTIYAQSTGSSMGQLVATSSNSNGIHALNGNVTICGGRITATGKNCGIYGYYYVTIHGGQVSATGYNGIVSGTIILGLRNATDYITASSYIAGYDAIYVKDGQTLIDENGNTYSGTLTDAQNSAIAGKTLYRYIANLDLAANQAPDQNYWTTFYCGHTGYEIDDTENAWAYTATYSENDKKEGIMTMHKLGKVIPQGTAVIIVGEDNSIVLTASTAAAENTVSNDLQGVDVAKPTDDVLSDYPDNTTLYFLSNKNEHFGFHKFAGTKVHARKAFLALNDNVAYANELRMVFEDVTTEIEEVDGGELTVDIDESWYTINGVKLDGKPTTSGVYIYRGKKVIVQ